VGRIQSRTKEISGTAGDEVYIRRRRRSTELWRRKRRRGEGGILGAG